MNSEIVPVFVLGGARNGTTWLCNSLGNHSKIASVRHDLHHGFHESSIFRKKQYYGDIEDDKNFIKFIEVFSNSDHFILAEGDKEFFYSNRPDNFYDFYFQLMDNFSIKSKKTYWLTKFDTSIFLFNKSELSFFIDELNKRYKDYKFISIQRNYKDVLKSYLNMPGSYYKYRHNKLIAHIAALRGGRYRIIYTKV